MGALQDLHPMWPYTGQGDRPEAPRRRKRQRLGWDKARKEALERMWRANEPAEAIADALETSRGAIYQQARRLGLPDRGLRGRAGGRKPVRPPRKRDPEGQRRFAGTPHDEFSGSKITLEPHHPAFRKATTIFPRQVVPASAVIRLLKSGEHSRKLGKTVMKGKWAGFRIFTLTLEERDTCPSSCKEWATCYGNNLHHSVRVYDDGTLTRRLWGELAALNAEFPAGFVVRLHILGDFFSVDYVNFWRGALNDFAALRIFGFTARQPADHIGAAVLGLGRDFADRVSIRVSGRSSPYGCAEVVDRAEDAKGIVCPAQRDEKRYCGNCCLCWQSDRTITFLRH